MAAEEQQIPELPPPNTIKNNLNYQSFLDNLHDFQSRGSKSQIKKSEEKIRTSYGIGPSAEIEKVSGHEREFVQSLENSTSPPLPEVVRFPNFTDRDSVKEIPAGDNSQLTQNNGKKLLKEIAGISQGDLPPNYEFIFMFDACSELTYCFLDNPNVYAIVTPEVIGDSAASSGNEYGYFKEDIMPQTPNIEHINPRRVIHFNSDIQHGDHLALGTQIQYSVPDESIYKSDALLAYEDRNKDRLDINKQFVISINRQPFKNGNMNCSSGTSVSILHKYLGFAGDILSYRPKFSSLKMFNPFRAFNIPTETKDKYCLDYKRGGDFNQAHSLRKFILQLNGEQEDKLTTPIDIGNKNIGNKTVFVVFASGDYFSAYHAAKYCGLCSIYFNGTRPKRKTSISFSSSTTTRKKTLSAKQNSWGKNNHTYAIFNSFNSADVTQEAGADVTQGLAAEEPQTASQANDDYIKILSHPFDPFQTTILQSNYNYIQTKFSFQLIKDTIETAIKIYPDNIIDDYVERTEGGGAEEEVQELNDHDVFESKIRLKKNRKNVMIVKKSKFIYEGIMKLIKFNNNSYLKSSNFNDIFSLSEDHLIIEKNFGQWNDGNGFDTNAMAALDDSPIVPNHEDSYTEHDLYTQHTLFDILILYLSDYKTDGDENVGNENVWSPSFDIEDKIYPFKEIIYNKSHSKIHGNGLVPSFYFYQNRKRYGPVKNARVTYGYGRYLNSNTLPEKDKKDFIKKIHNIKKLIKAFCSPSTTFNPVTKIIIVLAVLLATALVGATGRAIITRFSGGRMPVLTQDLRSIKQNLIKQNNPIKINSKTSIQQNISNQQKQTQTITFTKNNFNQFLTNNNMYLSNKLDILLNVVELSQHMREVNRLCSISFDECDEFIKQPNKEFMEKVKTIKTEFILNKIESAKKKLKKNNNDHYELIKILEIFNFFFNNENHDNIDFNSIFLSLQELDTILISEPINSEYNFKKMVNIQTPSIYKRKFATKSVGINGHNINDVTMNSSGGNTRKNNKIRLTKNKNKKTKTKNKKTKKRNKKTKKKNKKTKKRNKNN